MNMPIYLVNRTRIFEKKKTKSSFSVCTGLPFLDVKNKTRIKL